MAAYDVLFIDLDETLYPKTNGLWRSISDRINRFIVNELQVPLEDAKRIRQQYLDSHGTTLHGLMSNYDIDPLDYLEFVHDIPIENLIQPVPEIREILKRLFVKKFIFTNASLKHANRVLDHLNIRDLFDGVIDILALEFINKPRLEAYQKALHLAGNPDPSKCMLVDDRIVNLYPAKGFGITTVLVGDEVQDPDVDYIIPSMEEIINKVPGLT
jgi:putative hydrolase of the HAD superfamily